MRTSVINYDEALQEVNNFLDDYELDSIYAEEGAASCSNFPCPEGLDNWSGETNAIYVYHIPTGEEVFACAYWN